MLNLPKAWAENLDKSALNSLLNLGQTLRPWFILSSKVHKYQRDGRIAEADEADLGVGKPNQIFGVVRKVETL